ncbi:hypothetical protein EON66_03710 [archaeon]|nr:MAG: hypothetical protein EON66_03710 [archaeon]
MQDALDAARKQFLDAMEAEAPKSALPMDDDDLRLIFERHRVAALDAYDGKAVGGSAGLFIPYVSCKAVCHTMRCHSHSSSPVDAFFSRTHAHMCVCKCMHACVWLCSQVPPRAESGNGQRVARYPRRKRDGLRYLRARARARAVVRISLALRVDVGFCAKCVTLCTLCEMNAEMSCTRLISRLWQHVVEAKCTPTLAASPLSGGPSAPATPSAGATVARVYSDYQAFAVDLERGASPCTCVDFHVVLCRTAFGHARCCPLSRCMQCTHRTGRKRVVRMRMLRCPSFSSYVRSVSVTCNCTCVPCACHELPPARCRFLCCARVFDCRAPCPLSFAPSMVHAQLRRKRALLT